MFRVTPLVRNLIIINVVVFLAQMLLDRTIPITGMLSLWPIGSEQFGAYQLFTYMFAHGGFMHIFFNMLALASFAPILESYWGDKKFLIFYLSTALVRELSTHSSIIFLAQVVVAICLVLLVLSMES